MGILGASPTILHSTALLFSPHLSCHTKKTTYHWELASDSTATSWPDIHLHRNKNCLCSTCSRTNLPFPLISTTLPKQDQHLLHVTQCHLSPILTSPSVTLSAHTTMRNTSAGFLHMDELIKELHYVRVLLLTQISQEVQQC